MNFIERPNDLDIQLTGFEETVTAAAAVTAVMGEDHPLLLPGDHTYETSLWDEIHKGVTSEPKPVFTGEARDVIIGALLVISEEKSNSLYQPTATRMLYSPADKPARAPVPAVRLLGRQPEIRSHNEPSKNAPNKSKPLWARRRVSLCGFGEMIAAQHAVAEFVGEDSVLLEKGREAKDGHPSIRDALDTVEPGSPDVWVFDGKDGRVILRALKKAATRNETIYDAVAAKMLEPRQSVSSELRARAADALSLHR